MKIKNTLIFLLGFTLLLLACKKEEPVEPTPTPTPGPTPVDTLGDLTYDQSIGDSGSTFNQFDFVMGGQEMAWTLATDGNFVYVGDFANHCVKKVDLTTNSIVGWYGFQGNSWGYYTNYTTLPNAVFRPFRLVYKNNNIYAFSRRGTNGNGPTVVYKFDISGAAVDTNRISVSHSFFTASVDNDDNLITLYNDSIKIETPGGSVTGFGGTGSLEGSLNNSGYMSQIQSVNDTIVVMDPGNARIQKFTGSGSFISTFPITLYNNYLNLVVDNNLYYFLELNKFVAYNSTGTKVMTYSFVGTPANFIPGQKQFVVVGDKLVFQDIYNHKLHVYTK